MSLLINNRMKTLFAILVLCCALNTAMAAATPEPWFTLPPAEREALAPLQTQWNSLPEKQQKNLRHIAQHYPKLNPVEKKRFQSRLVTWAKLTPAQREAARAKYRAFHQVPLKEREQVKLMIRQQQALKAQQASSAVAPAPVTIAPTSAPTATQP